MSGAFGQLPRLAVAVFWERISMIQCRNLFVASLATLGVTVLTAAVVRADDWPQWLGPQRNGTWNETGIVENFPEGGPPIVWRMPVAGGYSGPAVANGRVFNMDYVLKAGDPAPDPGRRNELTGTERVLCFDEKTGKELWSKAYDCDYRISFPAGPRCTPTVDGDHVYCLGAMGRLMCLRVADGSVVWERELMQDYKVKECPIWGYAAHPLVHGDHLYCIVGGEGADGKGSVAVCFDKSTGKEIWHSVSAKEPGYCPPTLIEHAGHEQLLIWDPEKLNSLDPETGEVYWSIPCAPQYAMSIVAPVKYENKLLVAGIGNASLLAELDDEKPAASTVWSEKGFHPIHSPFVIEVGHIFGVDGDGTLRCLKLDTCERVWGTTEPTTGSRPQGSGTGFMVKNGDRFFIAGETGELTIAKLSPKEYQKISSAKLLEPTHESRRKVLWSHPAFANGHMYWRNDKEIICVDLRKK
jgi:outer membrane protein assembly factor BamB